MTVSTLDLQAQLSGTQAPDLDTVVAKAFDANYKQLTGIIKSLGGETRHYIAVNRVIKGFMGLGRTQAKEMTTQQKLVFAMGYRNLMNVLAGTGTPKSADLKAKTLIAFQAAQAEFGSETEA